MSTPPTPPMPPPPHGGEVCAVAGSYLDTDRYPVTFRPDPGPSGWPITVVVVSGPDAGFEFGGFEPEPWQDNSVRSHGEGLASLVKILYDEHREAVDPPGGRRLQ